MFLHICLKDIHDLFKYSQFEKSRIFIVRLLQLYVNYINVIKGYPFVFSFRLLSFFITSQFLIIMAFKSRCS